MKTLCEKTIVAAIKRNDPVFNEFKKEFNTQYQCSWVIVLDGKGETLAIWAGDKAGAGCTKESANKFAGLFVNKVHESLGYTSSLQELERNFEKDVKDVGTFLSLTSRLEDMYDQKKLQTIYKSIQDNEELKDSLVARVCSFKGSNRNWKRLNNESGKAEYAEEGEKLIAELAEYPETKNILQNFFYTAYTVRFDVPSKSAAGIERLTKIAEKHEKAEALKKLIETLKEMRQTWITTTENALKNIKEGKNSEWMKGYYAAQLGDAETTVTCLEKSKQASNPLYQGWIKEAKEKLEKSKGSKVNPDDSKKDNGCKECPDSIKKDNSKKKDSC